MFNLHIVQALHGDCFILEYGTAEAPRYILIDGGPQRVYEENVRPVLRESRTKGAALIWRSRATGMTITSKGC